MSLLKVRPWALVATLVALQAPVMFAIDSGATLPKKAKSDQQIQQIEQSGSQDGTVSVIIRADGKADWASLLSTLRAHGVTVGRIAPRANAIALTISTSDLAWLETLPGVASISIDAPVTSSPLSAEGLLTNTGERSDQEKRPARAARAD